MMIEQQVIAQLTDYKRIVARIKVLERHSVGNGITVSALSQDDQLQELHRKLRHWPSYMYLNQKELELETTANAYLTEYPLGTKSQAYAIGQLTSPDATEEMNLRMLQRKIQKVLEARAGVVEGIEGVLARLSELQDLIAEKAEIDRVLDALEEYRPQYSQLLRLRYIEGKTPIESAKEFSIVKQTFHRWQRKAIEEYAKLMG